MPPREFAIIMGNEVKGVKQKVVDMSDGCLEIPQFGTKHSLNVSTTAGIVMWEFMKSLRFWLFQVLTEIGKAHVSLSKECVVHSEGGTHILRLMSPLG